MSIGILVDPEGPQSDYMPVATEADFQEFWKPGSDALRLKWIPLFQSGLPVRKEDFPDIMADLKRLEEWMLEAKQAWVPREVAARVSLVRQFLERTQRLVNPEIWIG